MAIIARDISKIVEKYLFKGKIIIVYGARQVGKTTLVRNILNSSDSSNGYFNCELLSVKRQLESLEPYKTKEFLGDSKIIILDEAQKVENIGLALKQLIDTFPDIQIVATGSSSFDLSNKINEPLTGRAFEFKLYPLSIQELVKYSDKKIVLESLDKILTYGLYPEVYLSGRNLAQKLIETISSQYLYKDVLEIEQIKKPQTIIRLLELLAMQLGSEVSITELATTLQINYDTVERYLDLLEKSFVIFRLRSFSRNLRKEITKKNKVYFYDVGIRNAILNRYNALSLREDIGGLWENFLIAERIKYLDGKEIPFNNYFWRTHDQKEVDYIEEINGKIHAYEFKWKEEGAKIPVEFLNTYKNASFKVINKDNFLSFLV
ncbi:ATP-binding protein [Candidatus Parcubacteria bacterium]|nr:ATP-binding protein [Candidatus Parcubacteria bacterium]